MSLTATPVIQSEVGYWRVFATPPGGTRQEITIFRGAPVIVNTVSFGDPFSEQTAQISLPQVTPWDSLGEGDLDWLVNDCDIDIVWQNTGEWEFVWSWEGFIVSFDFSIRGSATSFDITLKGALYGLDDYQAKPSFPRQPIPYEHLIRQAFDQRRNPCRLAPLTVTFPADWELTVPQDNSPGYLNFLKPWGVYTGQKWTGFTSRSTGSWEPTLSGHVQSLLVVMFAEGGAQWTIRNNGRRRPELFLRRKPTDDDPSIIELTLGAPGVEVSGSKDYSQSANVLYGSGTDDAGISFNGMEVTPNGDRTYFKPFAHSPQTYPREKNPSLDPRVKPRETLVQFQNGVSEDAARKIAQAQWYRFSEPGVTGTIVLTSDVQTADGKPFPRMLIREGRSVRIKGLFGVTEGVLAHITKVDVDFTNLTTSMTFDTKYRDELTVAEVQARTKDALVPLRSLQVGKYSNTVQDLIMPWSYRDGSGCVPLGAKQFYLEKLPPEAQFPYEEWTTKHPPRNPAYAPYYIKINPTNTTDAKKNWSGVARDGATTMSIPIRMSQAGTIKLSQMAAYDKDGNVLKVKFHVSVWKGNSTAADAMPKFPWDPDGASPNPPIKFLRPGKAGIPGDTGPVGVAVNYGTFQPHPFFEGAWEQVQPNGLAYPSDAYVPAEGANLVVGWGNYHEPAGYWPGRFSKGSGRTGMMVDTTSWSWDNNDLIDQRSIKQNEEYAGFLFVQIYCDDQGAEPVYFMGRFFREEAGTA